MKFFCEKCNNTVEMNKTTMIVKDGGKIIHKEAICDCGNQMEEISKFQGFGKAIIRPGGKIRGKY